MCTPEIYTGSICREALQTQQSCLQDRNTTSDIFIAVDPASSQSSKEEQASLFIQGLPILAPGPECKEVLIPLLCFYIFPLCDSSSNLHQPSSEECREITEDICAREFQTAATFATEDQLPQCQLLPDTTLKCNSKTSTGRNNVLYKKNIILNIVYSMSGFHRGIIFWGGAHLSEHMGVPGTYTSRGIYSQKFLKNL